ncbi:sigma-70 family RNA polymerase sigma factor [Rapidithrix thailandica]|uniref:Sigma-70 family RNA polymerase sigma factor n=1 Tax=Rapidithrix thailandica TaxID=413964 RepID=A0AAW9RY33_9BACT
MTTENPNNDSELWNAFKNGQEDAYLKIYDLHYKYLFTYGFRLSSNKMLTDDCIQELFLELWTNRSTVSDVKRIRPYLLTYLKRKIFSELKRSPEYEIKEFDQHLVEKSFETSLIAQENEQIISQQLEKAISQLTNRQREILHLKYFQELSYEEISEVASIKVSRVYNLMYEAIKALRKQLTSVVVWLSLVSSVCDSLRL